MAIARTFLRTAGLAAGAMCAVAVAKPDSALGCAAMRLGDRVTRDLRDAAANAPRVLYRLIGPRPDPNVSDDVLADRIRSSLGPLEKRLDVPRVHVMVEDHLAIVHGDVPDASAGRAIETAILRVSGVIGLESHLHAGLVPGDTRPSRGRASGRPPSAALRMLLDTARASGAPGDARAAVHAVLCGFCDRIPEDERGQMLSHLPADVRALIGPVRRRGNRPPRLKTRPQLVAAVIAEGGIEPQRAENITRAVVAALRGLVLDEASDVAAVLPSDLRELWEAEPPG